MKPWQVGGGLWLVAALVLLPVSWHASVVLLCIMLVVAGMLAASDLGIEDDD